MKKRLAYIKPDMKVFMIKPQKLLAGSNERFQLNVSNENVVDGFDSDDDGFD